MHIENTLKVNLNSQQTTNTSWLVTTIKVILKTPTQKSENTIFSFRRTHEAAFRNSKILASFKGELGADIATQKASVRNSIILAAFKGDLCAAIAAQNNIPVNYGSELRDIASLENYSSITRTRLRSST